MSDRASEFRTLVDEEVGWIKAEGQKSTRLWLVTLVERLGDVSSIVAKEFNPETARAIPRTGPMKAAIIILAATALAWAEVLHDG